MADEVKVKFVCGCNHTAQSGMPIDVEGFVLCAEHKVRRYGWRSPLLAQEKSYPFDPEDPHYVERPMWGLSLTASEELFWTRLGIDISHPSHITGWLEVEVEVEPYPKPVDLSIASDTVR